MTLVVGEDERFQNIEEVAKLKMMGHTDTSVSKQLGIPRKEVKVLFEEYQTIIRNDGEARDLAKDRLYQMDEHYNRIIKKQYGVLDELEEIAFSHNVAAQKTAALRAIADYEKARLAALQQAGLLDSAELGDELAEMEEQMQFLISILREDLCPSCKNIVARKLSKVTKEAEEVIDVEVVEDNHHDSDGGDDE